MCFSFRQEWEALTKIYTQPGQELQYKISSYMKAGFNQTETAKLLNVHKLTNSRGIRRNRDLCGYQPKLAHEAAHG